MCNGWKFCLNTMLTIYRKKKKDLITRWQQCLPYLIQKRFKTWFHISCDLPVSSVVVEVFMPFQLLSLEELRERRLTDPRLPRLDSYLHVQYI